MPSAPDAYVHRIGRTGRAGREGTAITLAEPREHRLLRSIEPLHQAEDRGRDACRRVADLRARRLELTRASLRERLAAGDLDDVRVVVESLAEEFDVVDIAAAAVKLAHAGVTGDSDERGDADVPAPARLPKDAIASGRRPRDARHAPERDAAARMRARLFIGAGRRAGMRPADLVGAITNEAGLSSRDLGQIEIADGFSLVEVPEEMAEHVIAVMSRAALRGNRVVVRRDRDR